MKVKMLEDAPGSPDGVTVNDYDKDKVYDVTDSLGDVFLAHGLAEVVKQTKKATGPQENK